MIKCISFGCIASSFYSFLPVSPELFLGGGNVNAQLTFKDQAGFDEGSQVSGGRGFFLVLLHLPLSAIQTDAGKNAAARRRRRHRLLTLRPHLQ